MRSTVACPEAMIPDANQLMRCVGQSAADDQTFGMPNWQDAALNKYACASGLQMKIYDPDAPLVEPAWGCDLDAANRALLLLRLDVKASPLVIAYWNTADPQAAIAALEVTQIPMSAPKK